MYLRLLLLLLLCTEGYSQVHMFWTTAVIRNQYEQRKEEYLRSFFQVKSFGFDPWIIEATNIQSSFFDSISNRVFYPQMHVDSLRNKGVNEAVSVRTCIPFLPFEDEDVVIKLTGRYFINNRNFIDDVEATQNDYDVWGVYGKHFVSTDHLFTGCFAMRWKYLKKFVTELDCQVAEDDYIAVEKLMSDFIREHHLRVKTYEKLDVTARIFFSGPDATTYQF